MTLVRRHSTSAPRCFLMMPCAWQALQICTRDSVSLLPLLGAAAPPAASALSTSRGREYLARSSSALSSAAAVMCDATYAGAPWTKKAVALVGGG